MDFSQYGTADYANKVADKLSGFNLPENIAARRNVQIGQQSNEMKLRQMQQEEHDRAMALQEKELAKQAWQTAIEEGKTTGKSPLDIYHAKIAQIDPQKAIAAQEYQRGMKPKKVAFDETTGQVLLETPEGAYQRQQVEGWQPKMKIEGASNLRKLMEERNQFPQGSAEYNAYTNAIRKESETAKQITPTIQMPRQERMVSVIDPVTNAPMYVPQSEAKGMRPATGAGDGANRKPMTADQEAKYRQKFGDAYGSTLTALQSSANVVETAQKLKEHPGLKGMSGLYGYVWNRPGGDAASAQQVFETLQGKITKMAKDAAASSGAIGPMAVQEWKILRDQITAIDPTKLDAKQMQDVIDDLVIQAKNAERITEESYMSTFGPDFEAYPQFSDPRGAMMKKPYAAVPKGDLRSRADEILKGK